MLKKKSNLKALAFALCATTVAGMYAAPVFAAYPEDLGYNSDGTLAILRSGAIVDTIKVATIKIGETEFIPGNYLTTAAASGEYAKQTDFDDLKKIVTGDGVSQAGLVTKFDTVSGLVGTSGDTADLEGKTQESRLKALTANTKNITVDGTGGVTQFAGNVKVDDLLEAKKVEVGVSGLTVNGKSRFAGGTQFEGIAQFDQGLKVGVGGFTVSSNGVIDNLEAKKATIDNDATIKGTLEAANGITVAGGAYGLDNAGTLTAVQVTADTVAAELVGDVNNVNVTTQYLVADDVAVSGAVSADTVSATSGSFAGLTVDGKAVVTQDVLDTAKNELTDKTGGFKRDISNTTTTYTDKLVAGNGFEANTATVTGTLTAGTIQAGATTLGATKLNGDLTAGNATFNKGKLQQVIIDENGVKVGNGSSYITKDGFRVGGATDPTALGYLTETGLKAQKAEIVGTLKAGATDVASLTTAGAVNAGTITTTGNATIGGNAVVTGDLTVAGKDLGASIGTLEKKTQNILDSTTDGQTNFKGKLTAAGGNFEVDSTGNIILKNGSSKVNIDSTGAIETTGTIKGQGLNINNGVGEQLVVDNNGIQFVDSLKVGSKTNPVFTVNASTGDIDSKFGKDKVNGGPGTLVANDSKFEVVKGSGTADNTTLSMTDKLVTLTGANADGLAIDSTLGKEKVTLGTDVENKVSFDKAAGEVKLDGLNKTTVEGNNSDLVLEKDKASLQATSADASLVLSGVAGSETATLKANNSTLTLSKDTADIVAGTASVKTAAATGTTFANTAVGVVGTTNINGATITLNDGSKETVITTNGNNGLKIGDKEVLLRGADGNLFSDPNSNLQINTQTGNIIVGSQDNGTLTVGSQSGDKTVVTNGTATIDKSLTVGVTNKTVISEKTGYSEVLINAGLTNQTRIDKDGITVGIASTRMDTDGFYAGRVDATNPDHTLANAKAAITAAGTIKGAEGRYEVAADGSLTIKTTATDADPQFKVDATNGNTTVNGELHVKTDGAKVGTLDVVNGELKAVADDATLTMNKTNTVLANEGSKISLDNNYATVSVNDNVKLTLNDVDRNAKMVADNATLFMAKDTVNLIADDALLGGKETKLTLNAAADEVYLQSDADTKLALTADKATLEAGADAKLALDEAAKTATLTGATSATVMADANNQLVVNAAGNTALKGSVSTTINGATTDLTMKANSAVLKTDTDTKLDLTDTVATLAAGANANLVLDDVAKTATLTGVTSTTINGGNSSLTMADDTVVLETAAGNANLTLAPDKAILTGGKAVITTTDLGSAFTNNANGQTLINGGTITLNNEGKAATVLQANDKGGLQIVKGTSDKYDVVMRDQNGNLVIGTEAADGFDGANTDNNLLVNANKGMITVKGSTAEDGAKFELQDKDGKIKFLVDKAGLTIRSKAGADKLYVAAETGNITNNFEGGKLVTDANGLKVNTTSNKANLTVTDAKSEMVNNNSKVTLTDGKAVVNAGANSSLTLNENAANANLKADNASLNLKKDEAKITVGIEDKINANADKVTIKDGNSKVVVDDANGATFTNGGVDSTNINGDTITAADGNGSSTVIDNSKITSTKKNGGSTEIDGNKITMKGETGSSTTIEANGIGGLKVDGAYDVVMRDADGNLVIGSGAAGTDTTGGSKLDVNTKHGNVTVKGDDAKFEVKADDGKVKVKADVNGITVGNDVTNPNAKIDVDGNADFNGSLKVGSADQFQVAANGNITSKFEGGTLNANANGFDVTTGNSKLDLNKDDAKLSSKDVTLEGTDKATVKGGNSTITLEDDKATIDATATEVTGTLKVKGNATFEANTQTDGTATFGKTAGNQTIITDGNVKAETSVTVAGASANKTVIDSNGIQVGATTKVDKDNVTIADKVNTGNEIQLSDLGQIDNVDAELAAEMDNNMLKADGTVGVEHNAVNAVNAEAQIRRREIDRLDTKIESVGAMSAAIANLRTMGYDPAAPSEFSMSVGHYRGETALAAGFFHYPHKDFMLSMSVSYGHDEVMGGVGATWKFGHRTPAEIARIERERQAEKALKIAEAEAEAEEAERVAAQAARHQEMLAEQEAMNAK